MRRTVAVATLFAQILAVVPVPAARAATTSGGIAVLPLAGSGANATNRELLGQFLRTRVADAGLAPAGAEETRSAVSKAGGDCDDAACAASVGRALGVGRVVLGVVTRTGSRPRLTISAIDVATGRAGFSAYEDAANEDALFVSLGTLADRLIAYLEKAPAAPAAPKSAATPAPARKAATGALRIEHDAPSLAAADQPLVIEARVLPGLGAHMLFALHRVSGEGSFRLARMQPGDDGALRVEIPGATAGATIEYSLQIMDALGAPVTRLPVGEGLFQIPVGGAPAPATIVAEPTAEVVKGKKAKKEKIAKAPKVRTEKPKKQKAEAVARSSSGGGGKKWLWIGLGVAAAGVGAALAGGGSGGDGGSGPPPGPAGTLPQPPGRP